MCISAAVIAGASLAASAVGAVSSISSARYSARLQEMQLEEQRKQLRQQAEQLRIQAMEEQLARAQEYSRARANNLAFLAGSGIGQHVSYFQGISEAEQRALKYDLANIRLSLLGEENRIASQIRSTRFASAANRANRNQAILSAGLGFASDALGAANYYNTFRTPSGGTGQTSGNKHETFHSGKN